MEWSLIYLRFHETLASISAHRHHTKIENEKYKKRIRNENREIEDGSRGSRENMLFSLFEARNLKIT